MKTYAFGLAAVLWFWPLVLYAQETQPAPDEAEQATLATPPQAAAAQPAATEASVAPSQDTSVLATAHDPNPTQPASDDVPPDFWASAASEQPTEQRTYLGALYAAPEHEGLQGVQVLSVIPGSPAARAGFIGANTPQQQGTSWFRVAVLALSLSPAGAFAIPLTIAHHVYANRHAPADLPGDLIVAVDDTPIPDAQAFSRTLGSYEPGDRVTFTFIRAGKPMQIAVTLESEPF